MNDKSVVLPVFGIRMKARNTLDLPREEEEFTAVVVGALISNGVWCLVWGSTFESNTPGKSKNGVKHDSLAADQTRICENPSPRSVKKNHVDAVGAAIASFRIKVLWTFRRGKRLDVADKRK
jgi:hypothetical protein